MKVSINIFQIIGLVTLKISLALNVGLKNIYYFIYKFIFIYYKNIYKESFIKKTIMMIFIFLIIN